MSTQIGSTALVLSSTQLIHALHALQNLSAEDKALPEHVELRAALRRGMSECRATVSDYAPTELDAIEMAELVLAQEQTNYVIGHHWLTTLWRAAKRGRINHG